MTFGTNMHRVIELVLRRFAQLGRVNQAEVDEIFADVWRDDPYRSPAENSTYFKAGQKQINLFVKNFVQKLDPNDSFDVETVFNVDMDGVAITGRFDMVRESDSQTEIIDFKTGDEGDYSNQLTLYSACRKIQTGSDVQKLTIYYLKTGSTVDVQPAPDSVWKSEIKRVSNGINGNNFSATPGKHCGDCSFKMICTMAK
jgi:CRISPR/Cas system-associated exonuclease Cas4 (RecB family)